MKITLALGGGAGLGWAHIGVIRALENAGIKTAAISGTSIGAIVAACHAAGKLDILEDIARDASVRTILGYLDPHWRRGGLVGGKQIERRLTEHLGDASFADLAVPISVVAADLFTGEAVITDSGPIVPAVRASMSLPGIFPPVQMDGRLLVDGGAVIPVPVSPAKALAPDLPCVAVSLQNDYANRARAAGILEESKAHPKGIAVIKASVGLSLASLARYQIERDPPDVLLNLPVGHIELQNFTRADELIEIGRSETERVIGAIREAVERAAIA